MSWHTPGISPSEQECTKGRSCLAKLVSFHSKMKHSVYDRRAVAAVSLGFWKAFSVFSYKVFQENVAVHDLDKCPIHRVKKKKKRANAKKLDLI